MRILILLLAFGQLLQANTSIEKHLMREDVWELIDRSEEGYIISQTQVPEYGMYALQISAELNLSATAILDVVHDIEKYEEFLRSAKTMDFEMLAKTDSSVIGYQHIYIPYLSNRHYLYRFDKEVEDAQGRIITGWELLPRDDEYKAFIALMDSVYDDPIYLDEGVGKYILEPTGANRVKFSYRLYMDIGGWIPEIVLERINKQSILDLVRDLVKEAEKRSKI